jgi:hypothetical protein
VGRWWGGCGGWFCVLFWGEGCGGYGFVGSVCGGWGLFVGLVVWCVSVVVCAVCSGVVVVWVVWWGGLVVEVGGVCYVWVVGTVCGGVRVFGGCVGLLGFGGWGCVVGGVSGGVVEV